MRAFIAIELPAPVKEAIAGLRERLRRSGAKASWVKTENMHLTLRFLGDVPPERLDRLGTRFGDAAAQCAAFPLSVAGTGLFPNARRPSVVWAGVAAPEGGLRSARPGAEDAARAAGLPPDNKPFHPHITLARIRDRRDLGTLLDDLEAAKAFFGGDFITRSVSLFSSEVNRGGPVYRRLREFPLQCS